MEASRAPGAFADADRPALRTIRAARAVRGIPVRELEFSPGPHEAYPGGRGPARQVERRRLLDVRLLQGQQVAEIVGVWFKTDHAAQQFGDEVARELLGVAGEKCWRIPVRVSEEPLLG